jgi:hypothetical protein
VSLLSMLPAIALHAAAPYAPPPAAGRCSLTLSQPEPLLPGPATETVRFGADGRWIRVEAEQDGQQIVHELLRDGAGCPRELRRAISGPGDGPRGGATAHTVFTARCHPDGSLAELDWGLHAESWEAPALVDGAWVQRGVWRGAFHEEPAEQRWIPVGERGVNVELWRGGALHARVELRPGAGPRPTPAPLVDTALGQLARAGGEARVETDARGRLLRLEQRHRAPSGHVEAVEARWDPDGVGLTLDVEQHGGALTDALRCGPAGCAGGPGAVAQTWTCRAR